MVIEDMDRKSRVTVVIEARDMEDLVEQMRKLLSQIDVPVKDEPPLPLPEVY
jgi:nitrate reductase NapAB chaperone NapD